MTEKAWQPCVRVQSQPPKARFPQDRNDEGKKLGKVRLNLYCEEQDFLARFRILSPALYKYISVTDIWWVNHSQFFVLHVFLK